MASRDSLRIAWDITTVLCYVAWRCCPKYQSKQEEERELCFCTASVQLEGGAGWVVELLHFRAPLGLHLGVWF